MQPLQHTAILTAVIYFTILCPRPDDIKTGKVVKMLLGKVGNKSIAFINHKPFHPGNLQNLEKVWQAEQKAAEDEKRQKEMLERRKHEVQIEELRKALREKERQQSAALMNSIAVNIAQRTAVSHPTEPEVGGLQVSKRQRATSSHARKAKRQRKMNEIHVSATVCSKYKEDVFCDGHSSVWGSYFNRDEGKWGYACCKSFAIGTQCPMEST